jgi:hypothetical protein
MATVSVGFGLGAFLCRSGPVSGVAAVGLLGGVAGEDGAEFGEVGGDGGVQAGPGGVLADDGPRGAVPAAAGLPDAEFRVGQGEEPDAGLKAACHSTQSF